MNRISLETYYIRNIYNSFVNYDPCPSFKFQSSHGSKCVCVPCHSRQSVPHDKICTNEKRNEEFPRFLGFQLSENSIRQTFLKRTKLASFAINRITITDTLYKKKRIFTIIKRNSGNFFRLGIPPEIPIATNVNTFHNYSGSFFSSSSGKRKSKRKENADKNVQA